MVRALPRRSSSSPCRQSWPPGGAFASQYRSDRIACAGGRPLLNLRLRHEQGARRVRSTVPQVVPEHPTRPSTVPLQEGPVGSRAANRGATAKARTQRQRLATLARFAAVGASGIVVNQLILWLWVAGGEQHYLLGAVVATQGSSTWNFFLTERYVFGGAGGRRLRSRFLLFLGMNNSTLLLRIPVLALLTSFLGINYLVSNFLTLVVLFLLRFLVSDRLIWKPVATPAIRPATPRPSAEPAARAAPPAPRYLYQVGGFVSVGSDIQLRELQYFRVRALEARPDIGIRVQPVGERGLRARSLVTHGPSFVTYEEHLGQLGGNFRLDFERDRIDVAVAPLLGPLPPRRLHQRGRGAAAVRARLARLHAAPLGHRGAERARGDALGPDRHRQDRHHPAAPARARRRVPGRRHDDRRAGRPRLLLPQAADHQRPHPPGDRPAHPDPPPSSSSWPCRAASTPRAAAASAAAWRS